MIATRTNIGIVNLDPQNERTFDIMPSTAPLVDPPNGSQPVTVPPFSMQQVALRLNAPPGPVLQIVVQPRPGINPRLWAAYGSSVDNTTGDSWSSLAFPLLEECGGPP
jgi:hypothetical protein